MTSIHEHLKNRTSLAWIPEPCKIRVLNLTKFQMHVMIIEYLIMFFQKKKKKNFNNHFLEIKDCSPD